jgi:hypothetical protein
MATMRCANVDRVIGQACLRDEDCLSGLCSGQVCIAEPMLLSVLPTTDAQAGFDAGHDAAPVDAPPDVMMMATPDTGTPMMDTGTPDAPATDGPTTDGPAMDGAHPDAGMHDGGAHDGAMHDGGEKDGGSEKDAKAKDAHHTG